MNRVVESYDFFSLKIDLGSLGNMKWTAEEFKMHFCDISSLVKVFPVLANSSGMKKATVVRTIFQVHSPWNKKLNWTIKVHFETEIQEHINVVVVVVLKVWSRHHLKRWNFGTKSVHFRGGWFTCRVKINLCRFFATTLPSVNCDRKICAGDQNLNRDSLHTVGRRTGEDGMYIYIYIWNKQGYSLLNGIDSWTVGLLWMAQLTNNVANNACISTD